MAKKPNAKRAPKVGTWPHVNRQQLAAAIGVHPDTITDYARMGMPVVMKGGRGKESAYDLVACLQWWRENQGQDAKELAQTRQYTVLAELNELKLAVQRGELFERDAVIQDGQAYTKAWMAKVRALPRRLVQAGAIDRAQEQAVATYCDDLLRDIAAWKTRADTTRAVRESNAA